MLANPDLVFSYESQILPRVTISGLRYALNRKLLRK